MEPIGPFTCNNRKKGESITHLEKNSYKIHTFPWFSGSGNGLKVLGTGFSEIV